VRASARNIGWVERSETYRDQGRDSLELDLFC
jgi:hypothetical protein